MSNTYRCSFSINFSMYIVSRAHWKTKYILAIDFLSNKYIKLFYRFYSIWKKHYFHIFVFFMYINIKYFRHDTNTCSFLINSSISMNSRTKWKLSIIFHLTSFLSYRKYKWNDFFSRYRESSSFDQLILLHIKASLRKLEWIASRSLRILHVNVSFNLTIVKYDVLFDFILKCGKKLSDISFFYMERFFFI